MKKQLLVYTVLIIGVTALSGFAQDVEPFLGRWSLYLPGGAGWLEVRQETGYLDADLLWYGGSVVPVDNVYVNGDMLVVTQTRKADLAKDDDGEVTRSHILTHRIELQKANDVLFGVRTSPKHDGSGVDVTRFIGKPIPPLPPEPNLDEVKFGKPMKLFNGNDLTGWKLTNPDQSNGFKAVDGVLMNDPVQPDDEHHVQYGNLRTVAEFEDFNLQVEVNIPENSNSGIYLRGLYEVQIFDSYNKPLDSHHLGAIYSRLTPTMSAEKPPGEWQKLDITLVDRHVTVILNGVTIIDNQPVLGVTGGALSADQFAPGPIYLQGDHGKVKYRNIVLKPVIK